MFMLIMYIMEKHNAFGEYRINNIDKENHIITCDNGDKFRYWDNGYYLELL